MRDTDNIVSTAFNFGQLFSAGLDTRTGMFHVAITLGRLGNAFELKVAYNHLSTIDEGFGIGWSANISRYDLARKRLTLSNGQSYQVKMSRFRPEVECQYLKLQDINVTHQDEVLTVSFKDGTVEQFDSEGYLRSVTPPSGHTMTFSYRGKRLERVSTQSGLSLTLSYSQYGFTVTDSKDKHQVQARVSGHITDVILPDSTAYRIRYRAINGLYVIEYLDHPTGATEKLSYDAIGLRLPAYGPLSSLPAVIRHEIYGADVPRMTRVYRYSSNNFLGHGLPRYTPYVDNLFETASNYTYSSTETFENKEVTKTYNKYHLLIEETVMSLPGRQLMQKSVTEYYADTRQGIASQPAQYLLPRKKTVTYYNQAGESRSEVSEFEYDSCGNELLQIDSYGIQTRSVYYPTEGEAGSAPAAPSGIPFLLKKQTVSPSPRMLQGWEEDKVSTFAYGMHPSLQAGKGYPVKTREYLTTGKGRELSSTSFIYVNRPDVPEYHGLVLRTVTTEGSLRKSEDYDYLLNDGVSLSTVVTNSFQDGIHYTEEEEVCLHTGQQLSNKDRQGNRSTKEYDGLGRVIQESVGVGSEFEQTTFYRYINAGQNQLDIEVSDGTRRRITYDQLGREITRYATNSNGDLVLMSQQSYNSLGQISTRIIYDDFGAGEVGVSTTLSYDIWGEVSEEKLASGMITVTERDKAKNSQTQYIMAGGQRSASITTYYDERDEVIKEVSADGELVTVYDGFGRKAKHNNLFNVETAIERDDIGRTQREQTGDIITHCAFTNDNRELVTQLTVAGSIVGTRHYDALGRITSEIKGGLTSNYRYDTLADKPSVVIQPSGESIEYRLNLALGEITGISASDDNASFSFNAHGRLLSVSNNAARLDYTYHLNGQLKSESVFGKSTSYIHSRQGQLIRITDYMGHTEWRSYDRYHRLQKVELGQVTVSLSYDAFSRLLEEHIASSSNPTLVHRYTYDEQGRLAHKQTTRNGVLYLSQSYTYNKGPRLASKTIMDSEGSSTTENYRYDEHNRVVEVRWSGSERPDYLGVGAMRRQSFVFDSHNNITEVETLLTRANGEGQDTARYTYNSGRLVRITHSLSELPDSELDYDECGNLICDDQGRRYIYNALGRLIEIQDSNGSVLSAYTYSADGLQLKQTVSGQPAIELFYGLGQLLNERQGMINSRRLTVNERPISRLVTAGGMVSETGLVTDYKNSVLREVSGQASVPLMYTPYGEITRG
ncbi:hypothetical protein L1D31_22055 [Vibrio sp. Isolate23]|uniref:hypothetical protein n=1 Tax=Vibrio sp. Isolate23 TaxID=2908533 RepID=UPI001EFD708A|nr:hypothetical protein [Vibrio sp. Isolate23]MCG9685206.1 hypothetical protein [Vibrio sp. Isolate23]